MQELTDSSYRNTSCITIVVGEQEDRFEVHRDRLFSASSWFKTTLNSGLQETSLQQILLPTDDPEVVEIFVQWLYDADPDFSVITEQMFTQLAKLYEFANRLCIRELKNYIVWKLFELRMQNRTPPMSSVHYAFKHMPDNAPFRKILIAWFTWHQASARTLTEDALNVSPQFSVELVLAMVNKQDGAQDILSAKPESLYETEDN